MNDILPMRFPAIFSQSVFLAGRVGHAQLPSLMLSCKGDCYNSRKHARTLLWHDVNNLPRQERTLPRLQSYRFHLESSRSSSPNFNRAPFPRSPNRRNPHDDDRARRACHVTRKIGSGEFPTLVPRKWISPFPTSRTPRPNSIPKIIPAHRQGVAHLFLDSNRRTRMGERKSGVPWTRVTALHGRGVNGGRC